MNLTLTERDKKLLGLTACLAILAIFGVHLIRPALAEQEALGGEYEAALRKQQEYQAQIDARAALDDSIAQNEAALKTAGEPYYPGGLETRQMDDIITGLALKNGLFPQSLTLTEAAPGAVSAYLTEQEAAQTDGSADTSSDAESADSTDDSSVKTGAQKINQGARLINTRMLQAAAGTGTVGTIASWADDGDVRGMVQDIRSKEIGCILFGHANTIGEGSRAML